MRSSIFFAILTQFWQLWSNFHVIDNAYKITSSGLTSKIKPVLDVLERTLFHNYHPRSVKERRIVSQPFSNSNHVVYMDNVFTSGPLVEQLCS